VHGEEPFVVLLRLKKEVELNVTMLVPEDVVTVLTRFDTDVETTDVLDDIVLVIVLLPTARFAKKAARGDDHVN